MNPTEARANNNGMTEFDKKQVPMLNKSAIFLIDSGHFIYFSLNYTVLLISVIVPCIAFAITQEPNNRAAPINVYIKVFLASPNFSELPEAVTNKNPLYIIANATIGTPITMTIPRAASTKAGRVDILVLNGFAILMSIFGLVVVEVVAKTNGAENRIKKQKE